MSHVCGCDQKSSGLSCAPSHADSHVRRQQTQEGENDGLSRRSAGERQERIEDCGQEPDRGTLGGQRPIGMLVEPGNPESQRRCQGQEHRSALEWFTEHGHAAAMEQLAQGRPGKRRTHDHEHPVFHENVPAEQVGQGQPEVDNR